MADEVVAPEVELTDAEKRLAYFKEQQRLHEEWAASHPDGAAG